MQSIWQRSVQRLSSTSLFHYLATRMLGGRFRSFSFDEKYRSGQWNFLDDQRSELVAILGKYACNGHILILGCGMASITGALESEKYASILGIDLSAVAISKAMRYANDKVRFEVADMVSYEPDKTFSVILFSESLYYVATKHGLTLLKRLRQQLTQPGCFIVTIAHPDRFSRLLKMIRNNFHVIEDRSFTGSPRHLIVFR